METSIDYKAQLANEIRRIIDLEHNREQAQKFWEMLSTIQPKACVVKYGWFNGEAIDFLIAFERGGTLAPFDLFVNGIENKSEVFGFICGLAPNGFYIKYGKQIENDTHCFIDIRLKRNG